MTAVLKLRLAALQPAPMLRYLITGTALAILLGLICRGISKLLQPLTNWKHFSGTVIAAERQNTHMILTVSYTDSRCMQHIIVFPVTLAEYHHLKSEMPLPFVIDRVYFEAGNVPTDAAHAAEAEGNILLYQTYRRLLLRQTLRELMIQLLLWLAAALLCAAAIYFCFPNP